MRLVNVFSQRRVRAAHHELRRDRSPRREGVVGDVGVRIVVARRRVDRSVDVFAALFLAAAGEHEFVIERRVGAELVLDTERGHLAVRRGCEPKGTSDRSASIADSSSGSCSAGRRCRTVRQQLLVGRRRSAPRVRAEVGAPVVRNVTLICCVSTYDWCSASSSSSVKNRPHPPRMNCLSLTW